MLIRNSKRVYKRVRLRQRPPMRDISCSTLKMNLQTKQLHSDECALQSCPTPWPHLTRENGEILYDIQRFFIDRHPLDVHHFSAFT